MKTGLREIALGLLVVVSLWSCKDKPGPICQEGTEVPIHAQCEVDSLAELEYMADAMRIGLRKMINDNDPALSDPWVDRSHFEIYLNDLVGIHNSLELIGCAELKRVENIHTMQDIVMNEVLVKVDSSYGWVKMWQAGQTMTGEQGIDSLVEEYHFVLEEYYRWNTGHFALLRAGQNLNLAPILEQFKQVDGVLEAFANSKTGNSQDIRMKYQGEHYREYEYLQGSGDCASGCLEYTVYTFRINDPCEVEYRGMKTE